ncbi:homoserine O-acetyltransferase [Epithele typhae]|uniref:homoserine O-acetyltransferase n=1 Tax=Epithele typhae TaxID=378194 RepID=UPI002007EE50|nr:homoserine O-acetyltransferase [Epithele typhae]KAH9942255.1 homoserine O-acetyltransferase [Epithele typhae]
MADSGVQYHHHGRFKVHGGVLPDAVTAYQTFGDVSNPCIVFPTCYGAKLALGSQMYLVGENKALDPRRYFVVTFALFCNGEPPPYNGPYFPAVSYADNIRAQYAVLQHLGVSKVRCAIGFSMGGQQAYHWAAMYPDVVEKFVAICSSARTSPHNICFLEGPKAAMKAGADFAEGHYTAPPERSIRAFGRAYSAWAYGQAWFRQHLYKFGGAYPTLDAFLREVWEGRYVANWDANDMLALLETWQRGDISLVVPGVEDFAGALAGIRARGLIMPCRTDLYFCPEDSELEVAGLRDGELAVIESVWGHAAGGGANAEDVTFVTQHVQAFLED